MNLIVKTRENTIIQGKQCAYLSYDLRDRNLVQLVCDDLWSAVDCAVLLTEEANVSLESVVNSADRVDLFVLCITSNFLHSTNVNAEQDIQYAQTNGIPILPILMEDDLDDEYQARFPEIQYLKKYSDDWTAIPYNKKLSDYLSAVLVNDELIKAVRDVFDVHVFLSYRKKDRALAQELMRLIHSDAVCRDIAIWYDEYLVPGESFIDAIKKMIEESGLFAMVVTPSLLEVNNYVMREEYPYARSKGKDIFPISMDDTDESKLIERYPGIPIPVDGRKNKLSDSLLRKLNKYARKTDHKDSKHSFFVGLAYLLGIEMEQNPETGLTLITEAAEGNLPEAARKLGQIYRYGQGAKKDFDAAIVWQKKYRNLMKAEYKDVQDDSIHILIEAENELAEMELEAGRIKDARNTCWRGLELCRKFGRGSFYTPSRVPFYAKLYMLLGDVFIRRGDEKQAIECYTKDLSVYMQLSEENPDNWEILVNTCRCFFKLYDLNERYSDWYYEKILFWLSHALSIFYDYDVHIMLAKFYKMLGDFKGSDGKECFEKMVASCEHIAEKNRSMRTLSVLAGASISMSEWLLSHEHIEAAEEYVQKADDVCRESIQLSESRTGYSDLLKCYFQKANINRKYEIESKLTDSEVSAVLSQLYSEALQTLLVLEEKYPSTKNDMIAFKTCEVFYDLCTTETAMQAYNKALDIVRINPILYFNEFINTKRVLWKKEKLSPVVYQNYIEFVVKESNETVGDYEIVNQSESWPIRVSIEGKKPLGTVQRIMISEDVILGIRSEHAYSEGQLAYRSCHQIQICRADEDSIIGIKKDPTPDEYVYLLIETNSNQITKEKWIRCYG